MAASTMTTHRLIVDCAMIAAVGGSADEEINARRALVYQEGCRAAALFIDWRHKVIVLCTATVGLTFAGVTWAYKEGAGELAMAGALVAGSAISGLCVRFDRRNEELLRLCYDTVTECEAAFLAFDGRESTAGAAGVPKGTWTRIVEDRNYRMAASGKRDAEAPALRARTLSLSTRARRGRQRLGRWIPDTWGQLVPWAAGILSRVFLAGAVVCVAVAVANA
jgi:hypothetical protein